MLYLVNFTLPNAEYSKEFIVYLERYLYLDTSGLAFINVTPVPGNKLKVQLSSKYDKDGVRKIFYEYNYRMYEKLNSLFDFDEFRYIELGDDDDDDDDDVDVDVDDVDDDDDDDVDLDYN